MSDKTIDELVALHRPFAGSEKAEQAFDIMSCAARKLQSQLAALREKHFEVCKAHDALRAEVAEQCRLNAMGAEREAKLMAELAQANKDFEEMDLLFKRTAQKAFELGDRAEEAERNALERAERIVRPSGPRPCDCERCSCGNSGDLAAVATWDSDTARADEIRALMKEGNENV